MEPTTSPLQSPTYYFVHNTESAQIQCAFNVSIYKLLWKRKIIQNPGKPGFVSRSVILVQGKAACFTECDS